VQSTLPHFYGNVGIERRFPIEFQVQSLHVWMIFGRLRSESAFSTAPAELCSRSHIYSGEGQYGKELSQEIFNLMWQDMTLRMSKAGVHTMTLTRQTRELQDRFLGSAVSYDAASKFLSASTYGASKEITKILQQGLQIGAGDLNARADAVLAASLFRNIFEGSCSAQQLEAMVISFIVPRSSAYASVTLALRCAMFAASATP
jgi:hypothetical protein